MPVMRFKLLAGRHSGPDAHRPLLCSTCRRTHPAETKKCECGFAPTRDLPWGQHLHSWNADGSGAGNIIETTQNLDLLNGKTGVINENVAENGPNSLLHKKFELITETAAPSIQRVYFDIQEASLPELKAFAEEEEIPGVADAKTPDEARKIIRAARKAMQPA